MVTASDGTASVTRNASFFEKLGEPRAETMADMDLEEVPDEGGRPSVRVESTTRDVHGMQNEDDALKGLIADGKLRSSRFEAGVAGVQEQGQTRSRQMEYLVAFREKYVKTRDRAILEPSFSEGKNIKIQEFKEVADVSNVSVQVSSVEEKVAKKRIRRKGHHKLKSKKKSSRAALWNFQNKMILFTVILFILAVITWTLLWVFIFRTENKEVLYFVGLFRVANTEFLPEYRQKDSKEFLTISEKVHQVMDFVYKRSPFSKFYKQSIVADVSNNNNGGLLVHFWILFVVPHAVNQPFCEDCIGATLKDSIQTSILNRTSIGTLQSLAVDMDSVVLNAGLRSDYTSTTRSDSNCLFDSYADRPGRKFPLDLSLTSNRAICHIKLIALLGHIIRLSILSIQIEADNCISDSLTIYDSLVPIKSKILYRFCEPTDSLISFVSTNNIMLVTLISTQVNKVRSIHGYFEAIPEEKCGNVISMKETDGFQGKIFSPYYPSYYPSKCICRWSFQTPNVNLGVALKFHNYAIKVKNINGCEHGWWKINEEMYCGYYIDYPTVFYAANSVVNIEFQCSSKISEQPLMAEYGNYDINHPCPADQFRCSTGLCIEKAQQCDGINDCFDESDELYCAAVKKDCQARFPKQHHWYDCNGVKDCEDGRDEQNCTESIPCNSISFNCNNGICIKKQNAKCDGAVDCPDGSDEISCNCGQKSKKRNRIVGGTDSVDGEWPWQVSLLFSGAAYCGASVVSRNWLISAAHCFQGDRLSDPRKWTAHLGMRVQGYAKFVSFIKRIIPHEYYDNRNFDYDIALLQLSTSWASTMNQLIQPICIPPAAQKAPGGTKCWVTGWGKKQEADVRGSSILQKAEVEIINQTICLSTYGIITPRMVCAGIMSGKRDACKGDSGGPLACQRDSDGRWFLAGVVSWGFGCGRPNFPGVYTRVSNFEIWIRKHLPSGV
ncbi:transmembrane protease serine 7 [Ambystoma mexicanum]|uniref:transmembrane protease serine 7 n=1 Tax=Ambystoma mexicanum TaxID=8296 RepID=UPI0037E96418